MLWLILGASSGTCVQADPQRGQQEIHRVAMDVYIRPDSDRCRDLCDFLKELAERRRGLDLIIHDVVDDTVARRHLYELGDRYQVRQLGLPAVHVMDQFQVGYTDSEEAQQVIEALLSIEVYTRAGCPRCQDAKMFLQEQLIPRWPALKFEMYDIVADQQARDRLMKLAQNYQVQASSVPAFHLCRQLKIGYLGPTITGREIEGIIRQAARPIADRDPELLPGLKSSIRTSLRLPRPAAGVPVPALLTGFLWQAPQEPASLDSMDDLPPEMGMETDTMDALPPLPGDAALDGSTTPADGSEVGSEADPEMEVPVFGRLNAEQLGMPVFTFLIGLVDGFNPCAMWVLMFLLSVLVNIRERKKILVIAGTFVVVSGLAYYAFMAAWLNVFMLVGLDRPAQLILGATAIVIGVVNVKDFFAFGKGVSFSIPDSAKPGIYARVRRIVAARHLWAALTGAIVLAVLVNVVELLCTAGLPAMYTKILTMQQYSPVVNYLYLGLYIVAYMLDDSLLVAVVVITLSRKKLQESQGRWLKLLSGLVILGLGIVMIAKPDLLV
ncbi:MAG: glutaredoxin domain-containing protein [Fuerstiella sp.]